MSDQAVAVTARRGPGRPPTNPEWNEWIDRAADKVRAHMGMSLCLSRGDVVDALIAIAAKHIEMPPPPKRY